MSLSISIPKTGEQVPLDGLLSLARAAFGLGIGMLVADKVRRPFRQATAIALVSVGALAAVPLLVLLVIRSVSPEYLALFDTFSGQLLLMGSLVSVGVGYFMMRLMSRLPGEERVLVQ